MNQSRRFWESRTLGLMLVGMAGLNLLAILSRRWLHLSVPWVEELEVGVFVWTIFLSGGVAVVRGMHLGFSTLAEKMPIRVRAVLDRLGLALFGVWFALFAGYGTVVILNQIAHDQRTPTLGWPQWVFVGAVPIGGAIGLWRLAQSWRDRRS